MKTYKVIKRPSSVNDRLVVISPNAMYLVSRQKGYYQPAKQQCNFVIEPVNVEFSIVTIDTIEFNLLKKEPDVAIIQTGDSHPDLHALRLKLDLDFFGKAAHLLNRYPEE